MCGPMTAWILPVALATLVAPLAPSPAKTVETSADVPDAKALFLANCATCHGETGDGQGVTQLDRPARSFKDGGFSFGNTPEALFRTITTGIPGTPMPGFAGALTDEERRAVAAYVRTLGPEVEDGEASDAELVVADRPLVVRGMLPPIAEGAPSYPRGLLIGTPSGLTFEYRADDVRLLGVRQGGFVRRTDWVGRGGTGLEPLGKLVYFHEAGQPQPCYEIATAAPGGWAPLRAELRSTTALPAFSSIGYALIDEQGREVALVDEQLQPITKATIGSGFQRTLRVQHLQQEASLRVRLQTPGAEPSIHPFTSEAKWTKGTQWHVARRDDLVEVVGTRGSRAGFLTSPAGVLYAHLKPRQRKTSNLNVTTLLLPAWDDTLQAAIQEEF